MLKNIITIALILLSSQKVFAEVKMHQIESETPAIAVFNPGSENLTETVLLGIRLKETPVLANKCGQININYSQYNIGGELVVLDESLAIAKLVEVNQLTNQAKIIDACATQDYKIVARISIVGFQPNKPYIVQEKVLNYRKIRYNSCAFAVLPVANVISYNDEGVVYFDIAGKKAATPEQLESFFSPPLAMAPICSKQQVYYPVSPGN